jgi:hypothetical protein
MDSHTFDRSEQQLPLIACQPTPKWSGDTQQDHQPHSLQLSSDYNTPPSSISPFSVAVLPLEFECKYSRKRKRFLQKIKVTAHLSNIQTRVPRFQLDHVCERFKLDHIPRLGATCTFCGWEGYHGAPNKDKHTRIQQQFSHCHRVAFADLDGPKSRNVCLLCPRCVIIPDYKKITWRAFMSRR